MDKYHSVHGQDTSSFDLPSTHRLPTVSAAQALEDLGTDPARFVSTSIEGLDRSLNDILSASSPPSLGGFQRGQLNEIWGPPGSGKTTFGAQLAANALHNGNHVVWVDAFHTASGPRLREIITQQSPASPNATATPEGPCLDRLIHYQAPSLSHLIALLCKPTARSVPPGTSLVVIDGLSALINHTFPRNSEPQKHAQKGTRFGNRPGARRNQLIHFITASLQKLAATKDLVVVIFSQCATRMQAERGASLISSINSASWDKNIVTRLVLFRDWVIKDGIHQAVHLVGIQKLNGRMAASQIGPAFAFLIHQGGLYGVEIEETQQSFNLSSTSHAKRKFGQTGFEVADSEDDEDYGWEVEDEAEMPAMPPQYQGSEDLLLGQAPEDDGDEGTIEGGPHSDADRSQASPVKSTGGSTSTPDSE